MAASPVRFRLGLVAVLGVVAIAVIGWPKGAPENRDNAVPRDPGAPFVRSMEGTVPDGSFQAWRSGQSGEASGTLALGELRRMFDYYLSAVGEKSIVAITQQINSELERTLPAQQVPNAKRILGLYLEFKRELMDVERKPGAAGQGVQAIRNRLLAMQDLRARYFTAEETQAMFGFEDEYDMDAVARLEVSQNPALSEQQKKDKLAALDAAMPADLRAERDAPQVVLRMEEKVAAMRAKGASDDEVYRMRSKAFSPEAAARLADLDRDEAAWKNRIATYLAERSQLLSTKANAPEADRLAALQQLQQSQFSEDERRRLPAYEN